MYQKSMYEKAMFFYREGGEKRLDKFVKEDGLFTVRIRHDVVIDDVVDWCRKHCPINYFYLGRFFHFSKESDAVMVKLTFG